MEKISKFFRFLRDEKTLSFLRLLTHGGRAMPAPGQPTSPASISPPSEQIEKISKFFRFLRDEKTLSFLRLLAHGGRALPASRQPTSPASMSPPSEQVEKISKFFRFLTQHLCSASICVYQPLRAIDRELGTARLIGGVARRCRRRRMMPRFSHRTKVVKTTESFHP